MESTEINSQSNIEDAKAEIRIELLRDFEAWHFSSISGTLWATQFRLLFTHFIH